MWCSTSNNSSDKIPPIETVPPSQFDDMSKEELKRELAASFEIRAAMAAKLELVEDQLRATVSEVCKILALKRETEFELERMKEKIRTESREFLNETVVCVLYEPPQSERKTNVFCFFSRLFVKI